MQGTTPTLADTDRPLFSRYPALRQTLPHVGLGGLPTPVDAPDALADALGLGALFIKRDDLSGPLYGGNKVRKLEFLLADALKKGKKTVMTFGFAGSNHCTATAIYAKSLGLHSLSMLLPQTNARSVRRNLLVSHAHGAEIHHYLTKSAIVAGTLWQTLRRAPYRIPAGGSSPLGVCGMVNAAFEIEDQVNAGVLDEPDCLYVAVGSLGSCVGLTLGFKATALHTRVVPIRVIPEPIANRTKAVALYTKTLALLRESAPDFPDLPLNDGDLHLRGDYFGPGYGQYTQAGVEALRMLRDAAGITIDGTYSAKALAALLGDSRQDLLRGKKVLFWNTYNSIDVSRVAEGADYRSLPRPLHAYFAAPDDQTLDTW